jgi:hypothetical protein
MYREKGEKRGKRGEKRQKIDEKRLLARFRHLFYILGRGKERQ